MAHAHPTISEWERDEHEGFYQAELHGWTLKAVWNPNSPDTRGFFHWTAARDDVGERQSEERFEELALAMAAAEAFARDDETQREAAKSD
jgi:hypothetical protein